MPMVEQPTDDQLGERLAAGSEAFAEWLVTPNHVDAALRAMRMWERGRQQAAYTNLRGLAALLNKLTAKLDEQTRRPS
jgi:hypothetical protein